MSSASMLSNCGGLIFSKAASISAFDALGFIYQSPKNFLIERAMTAI